MAYVDLPGGVSLYYERVRPFDGDLPTLVILSPAMHSITLFGAFLAHNFWAGWNIVIFDLRFHGRGSSPASDMASVDFAVHAVDVAFAMESLQLPPAHFYCPGVSAYHTGIHFGILFPDLVLSLSFVCVYSLFNPNVAARQVFQEIDRYISEADTQDDYIEGIAGVGECCPDLRFPFEGLPGRLTDQLVLRSRGLFERSEQSVGRNDRHPRGDARACEWWIHTVALPVSHF